MDWGKSWEPAQHLELKCRKYRLRSGGSLHGQSTLRSATVSAKVRVDAFVSSAESVFQRREGRKSDDFWHCCSTVSYYFRRAYIHVVEYLIRVLIRLVCFQGDRQVGMLSEWELSRMRVWVRRPTSAHCNIVEYVLTGGWHMVQSGKRD